MNSVDFLTILFLLPLNSFFESIAASINQFIFIFVFSIPEPGFINSLVILIILLFFGSFLLFLIVDLLFNYRSSIFRFQTHIGTFYSSQKLLCLWYENFLSIEYIFTGNIKGPVGYLK